MTSPEKTAIERGKISRPMRMLISELDGIGNTVGRKFDEHSTIFDYGCGYMDDIHGLRKRGYTNVDGWDPYYKTEPNPEDIQPGSVDIATCFYVMDVLPDYAERVEILKSMRRMVGTSGIVVLAARSKYEVSSAVKYSWLRHNDGWITSSNTFQQGLSAGDLAKLLLDNMFEAAISVVDSFKYSMVIGHPYLLTSNFPY
jgi:DNA phosphorothioation-associated putative methyltransferase